MYVKWIGEKVAKRYDITLMENGFAVQPDGTDVMSVPFIFC